MKACFALGVSLLVMTSTLGCCGLYGPHSPCDPCGGGGCPLKKLMKHKDGCGCGCKSHGLPMSCPTPHGCGMMPSPSCAGDCGMGPVHHSAGDCGCGQPQFVPAPAVPAAIHSVPQVPPATTPQMKPVPQPSPEPPLLPMNPAPMESTPEAAPGAVPEEPGSDLPAPPATSSNWQPANGKKQPQLVSYEEFQKLPGQVVSGSTTTAYSGPAPGTVPAAPGLPTIHPATWAPATAP
jgi:hypothetical protein